MKLNFKRVLSAVIAAALSSTALAAMPMMTSSAATGVKYEFEDGSVSGDAVKVTSSSHERYQTGASGDAFVFIEQSGTASVTVNVDSAGLYDVSLTYSAPFGAKTQNVLVNGSANGTIAMSANSTGEWQTVSLGNMNLKAGDNTIGIQGSWGWADVDYLTVTPFDSSTLPEIKATDKATADPAATAEAQGLFAYLHENYGKHVISGQQEFYNVREDDFEYIYNNTGKYPAIRGFDLGNATNPLYSSGNGETDRMIKWVNDKGGIATVSWHLNVPKKMSTYTVGSPMSWNDTTYTEETDFVVSNCWKEGTKEYSFFEESVKNLAGEFKKLQDANVPILWRPFHEAEGGGGVNGEGSWFWWSKDGARIYVYLYQYLFNKLTTEYGIHNLIWEFNSYCFDGSEKWYPGDDYVDLIGYDSYLTSSSCSARANIFYDLMERYDYKKMIALMENDTIPSVENMDAEKAYWSYFMPWYGELLYDYTDKTTLSTIYNSDLVISLDEVADYKNMSGTGVTRVTGTTVAPPVVTTATTPDVEGVVGTVRKTTSGYTLTFPESIGEQTVNVMYSAGSDISSMNGGFGVSTEVGGTYYWVNYQWEAAVKTDGTFAFTLSSPLNITYDNGKSSVEEGTALFDQVNTAAKATKSGDLQVWWVGDKNGEQMTSYDFAVSAAYLTGGASTKTTTTTTTTVTDPKVTTTTVTKKPTPSGAKSAFEIVEEMGIGWNLGNTMDSTVSAKDPTPNQTETGWGQKKTTQAMIDAVKAKGFNTVRIPTTWYQHVDADWNIDEDYLARVKEIVDYCYNDDMYVILNVHHENWINRSDFDTAYDEMSSNLTALWRQIATYFKDYDQHLIFEGMNEPRAAGTTREWWGATSADKEVINKLNADFVNTVRGIDSPYQDTRLLMCPPYCASSDSSMYGSLVIPNDDPFVAASIHAYAPYNFTMGDGPHDTWTDSDASSLKNLFAGIQGTFLAKGIPVVIGEFSASNYGYTDARVAWAKDYATITKEFGMPIVLWDNNVVTNSDASEAHGYLNRNTGDGNTWFEVSEPVVDALCGVYADASIPFGGENKVAKHADIDSGTTLSTKSQSLDGSVENGNCTENYDFSWADVDGKEIAVEFTGDTPKAAMMDANWEGWKDCDPYEVTNGIAYYSADALKAAWTSSNDPAHLCFTIYSGKTTITKIAIIDAPTYSSVNPPVTTTTATTDGGSSTTTTTTTTADPDPKTTTTEKGEDLDPNVAATLYGDVNNDGEVNITDIIVLNKSIIGAAMLSDVQKANADVYHDFSITSLDVTLLLKYLVNTADIPVVPVVATK